MIKLTTHTLDSSDGTHAARIPVKLSAISHENKLEEIWSKTTDQNGRLEVNFEIDEVYSDSIFQLTFSLDERFGVKSQGVQTASISLNINFPDLNGIYHLPIIISPYGASLWWSN
tara:strand:- start:165 stop:509 length:345 start_codon:yes stop_codon:yes gene_type:complete